MVLMQRISGVDINASVTGIRLLDSPSSTSNASVDATINGNLIVGGVDAVNAEEQVDGTVSASLTENSLNGTTGIAINTAGVSNNIPATCNWFGTEDNTTIISIGISKCNSYTIFSGRCGWSVNPFWSPDIYSCTGLFPVKRLHR